jgi:rsbT co-antagonist protein RsbR
MTIQFDTVYNQDLVQDMGVEAIIRLYRATLNHLPMNIILVEHVSDDNFRIILANHSTIEMSTYPDYVGLNMLEIYYGDESVNKMLYDKLNCCIRTGEIAHDESYVTLRDNQSFWLRTDFIPVSTREGQNTHVISFTIDITKEKLRQIEAEEQRQIIEQQSQALAEVSTPLLSIGDDIMVMPLIGAIDSRRIQYMISNLLNGVSERRARYVILDITGVPVVDTQVANVLIQSAQAVKLLGAQIILSGIRPEVAQILVGLGIEFREVITRATLQAAIATCQTFQEQSY